jgi:hypothetical protein
MKEDSIPKAADYVMVIVPTPRMKSAITQVTSDAGKQTHTTINQTLQPDVCSLPIICSIETKKGGNDEDDGKYKLIMWTIAWQNRVRLLTDDGVQCPPLPGLLILGSHWYLYWIIEREENVVCLSPQSVWTCTN